ncbi:hypothetical protein AB0383_08700 [Amycolatopsis sp. NPDC051373]|uniref:NACHT N-terminal Helical domain 1-containing protein n=1 Tax=Amycolatopsis sp. NPDC051373 TaxID=3155801 RepID=UPI00344F18AB
MPVETALLSGQLTKERDRRRLKRVLDNFAEAVVDRIEPIVDVEFRSLPEHEKLVLGWGGQGERAVHDDVGVGGRGRRRAGRR